MKITISNLRMAVPLIALASLLPAQDGSFGTPQGVPPGGPQPQTQQGGRLETVQEKIWIPARTERLWVEPVYATSYDEHGRPIEVMVEPGAYRIVNLPGRYETVTRQVWVSEPRPPIAVPVTSFVVRNHRQFQIQLDSVHVALADGSTVAVALPRDRVISSTSQFGFDLPPQAVSVTVRFKTWDWGNRRFQFPIYSAHYPLQEGGVGVIY